MEYGLYREDVAYVMSELRDEIAGLKRERKMMMNLTDVILQSKKDIESDNKLAYIPHAKFVVIHDKEKTLDYLLVKIAKDILRYRTETYRVMVCEQKEVGHPLDPLRDYLIKKGYLVEMESGTIWRGDRMLKSGLTMVVVNPYLKTGKCNGALLTPKGIKNMPRGKYVGVPFIHGR